MHSSHRSNLHQSAQKANGQNTFNGIHMKGEVEDGNVSIVIPLEDPERIIEYDIRLAFQKATFRKSRVFDRILPRFHDFSSKTQSTHARIQLH